MAGPKRMSFSKSADATHRRRMSAPEVFITSCGDSVLPLDFDIFSSPFSSRMKPCVSTTSKGARPREPQDSKSDDWNQPRCWSEPSRYMTRSLTAVAHALEAGEAWEVLRVIEHEGVRRARLEPHVENVAHLLPLRGIGHEAVEEALARALRVPDVGALFGEGLGDARDQLLRFRELGGRDHLARLLVDEDGDRHAPGALARDDPIGPPLDHAADAVLARGGHPLGLADRLQRELAQALVVALGDALDGLVQRDEPLRRVAEDDGLLGAPGVRILMLQAPARDERARFHERLDDGVVGVALVALLGEDALACEARRVLGHDAVGVDGEGDGGVDAARFERGGIRHPDLVVVGAVAGRGVHEAGAGVVGDVIAIKQRNVECRSRVAANGWAVDKCRQSLGTGRTELA